MTLTTIARIDCWSDENYYDAGDDAVFARTMDLLGWTAAANAALNVVEISGANFVENAAVPAAVDAAVDFHGPGGDYLLRQSELCCYPLSSRQNYYADHDYSY